MNYTKTIREYCAQNQGDIFDVSYMKDAFFEMVPYKTLLKILNRLEKENVLTCIAKGEYLIDKDGVTVEDAIIRRYVADGHGMFAGAAMFDEIGIAAASNGEIEVYSNRLAVNQKHIGKYHLIKFDIPFTKSTIAMVRLLECIERGHTIANESLAQIYEAIDILAEEYRDAIFCIVIYAKEYHYSTIVTLSEILEKKQIQNRCLELYKEVTTGR